MTFENTKRKIPKIQEQSIEDETRISRQENTNNQIDVQTRSIIPSQNNFKVVRDLDFDWEDFDFIEYLGTERTSQQYKIWSIEFSQINESFIPYITAEVLIRPKDSATGDIDFLGNDWKVVYFFEVEDIPTSDILKHVTMHIHFFNTTNVQITEDVPLHQVKLLVNLMNPMDFI